MRSQGIFHANVRSRSLEEHTMECYQLKAKWARKSIFIEEPAMWFPTSITDAILIKKAKQFSERLNCEDFLPSGGWLNCFKFLVLHFYDETVFTCMF